MATEVSAEWCVYILRTRENKLYTGITNDLDKRLAEHRSGGARSAKALRGKVPLTLVFTEPVRDRSEALRLEARIKKLSKAEKEALVAGADQQAN